MTFSKISVQFCTILHLVWLPRNVCTETTESGCVTISATPKQQLAYIDWPYKISCNLPFEHIPSSFDIDELEENLIECFIQRRNVTVYEAEASYKSLNLPFGKHFYILKDLKEGDETNYSVQLQATQIGMCVSMEIHLNLTLFEETTCEEFSQSHFKKLNYNPTAVVGRDALFQCVADEAIYPRVDAETNISYKWLRNCSERSLNQTTFHSNSKNIHTTAISFEDAGLYTCSIEYKGMKRYIAFHAICINHQLTFNEATLRCSHPVLRKNAGEDAVFECTGDFGEGSIDPEFARVKWEKVYENGTQKENDWCERRVTEEKKREHKKTKPHNSISCDYADASSQNACFYHVASPLERKIPKALLNILFRIRNIKNEDFGRYRIALTTQYEDSMPVYSTVTVERNVKPQTYIIIMSCIATVVLLILAIFISIKVARK